MMERRRSERLAAPGAAFVLHAAVFKARVGFGMVQESKTVVEIAAHHNALAVCGTSLHILRCYFCVVPKLDHYHIFPQVSD